MNKKAVSPMVATILLIAFAIALGAVVMNWGKGFIEEKAEFVTGVSTVGPSSCGDVQFGVLTVGGSPQVCYSNGEVRALVQNQGIEIANMKASVISPGGVTNQENLLDLPLKSADSTNVKISYDSSEGSIIQLKLIPQIQIDGKLEFCTAQGITLENIGQC